jgi:putative DNA methylase
MGQKIVTTDPTSLRGWHSRGYLPHFDGGSTPQTVAFRLADCLPASVIESWRGLLASLPEPKAKAELRRRIEEYIDAGHGECHLRNPAVAAAVQDSLLFFDGPRYRLHAWVVMPNHVHVLFTPCAAFSLSGILHSWKSYTSKQAGKILGRTGPFWEEDYFDRFIRDDEHFVAARTYIENNPVKAALCSRPEDWPFSSASYGDKAGGTPALRPGAIGGTLPNEAVALRCAGVPPARKSLSDN